ncbi:uncharacterized protein PG986_010650 [Apiospora aurea]|uniref:BTB domain-containing protein n=1 Tax=Apiospora aurea TaxID=335848 RepID=A0ABR1Q3J2_9PEZI
MSEYDSIPKEPWGMMQRVGKEMFNNEFLSDAKVTVDDTTWPVHKSILCSRSEYFRKAFTGPFSEATSNQLTIEGQDATAVEMVLYYLFTGHVHNFSEIGSIRGAFNLFVAADYFDIEYMKQEALERFDYSFHAIHPNEPLLNDEDLGALFCAARLAYSSGPNFEVLREPIEEFIIDTDFLFTKDDRFMRELNNFPEFALALMRVMTSPENEEEMLICCRSMPEKCTKCGLDKDEFAETSLISYPEHDRNADHALVGICTDCF